MSAEARDHLLRAAHIVAGEGLSDAFGHVSVRVSPGTLLISPPRPLDALRADDPFETLEAGCEHLPEHAPKEAWIHSAIAAARPDARGIVRAQPRAVAALAASGHPLRPLHGHGVFVGDPVPVYDDSRLIRDPGSAAAVSRTLGEGAAIILRGNGAVTVGETLEHAVALMWVLERSAELTLRALATTDAPRVLPAAEQRWWTEHSSELLARIFRHLELAHEAAGQQPGSERRDPAPPSR